MSGEGPVAPPDASLDVAADFGPVSAQANVTLVDNKVFAGLLGQNFEIEGAGDLAGVDIGAAGPAVLGWAEAASEPVRTQIDGTPVVRISATVNRDAAIDDLGPLLSGSGLSEGAKRQLRDGLMRREVEFWIGQADLLPRTMTVGLTLDGEVDELRLAGLDLDATLTFSDYGNSADIRPPEDAQRVPLDDLGSLLGG